MATQDEQQVMQTIHEWMDALNKCDTEAVKKAWDSAYDKLVYIAEENNDALYGWEGVDGYYEGLKDVSSADWSIDNVQLDVIGSMAWVYLTYVVKAHLTGFGRTMVFPGRNTFILRKHEGEWKIIHYHESLSRDESRNTWDWYFQK